MDPRAFPFFEADDGRVEPDSATRDYNCIAWSLGRVDAWWWPDAARECAWPEAIPRDETVAAFVAAFATVGYQVCESGGFEAGWEKVALYALGGVPTHAARQQPDGTWTSKLGRGPRVTHRTPRGVEGPLYGSVCCYLRRRVTETPAVP
jgi:hypothetical protein